MLYRSPPPRVPGVLFAEDFGDDDEEESSGCVLDGTGSASQAASEPSLVVPTGPTVEQIEEDRRLAREEGFNAGLQAGQHNTAAERTKMLGRLEETLKASLHDMHDMVMNNLAVLADTFLSGLVECLPALCERYGMAEMSGVVRSMLPTLEDDLQLAITVHPDVEDTLREEIVALGLKTGQIKIALSDRLLIGDVIVKWEDGSASRDISRWRNDMLCQLTELSPTRGIQGRVQ